MFAGEAAVADDSMEPDFAGVFILGHTCTGLGPILICTGLTYIGHSIAGGMGSGGCAPRDYIYTDLRFLRRGVRLLGLDLLSPFT